jgi:hypothetical protein
MTPRYIIVGFGGGSTGTRSLVRSAETMLCLAGTTLAVAKDTQGTFTCYELSGPVDVPACNPIKPKTTKPWYRKKEKW